VIQTAAAPKKEPARITLPAETGKPALQKATVKMGQTQPLVNRPAAAPAPSAALAAAPAPLADSSSGGGSMVLGAVALVCSIAAFLLVLLAFQSAGQ
jgi:hypothetical protein